MCAAAVAAALDVPLFTASHQEGHLRAALHGNEELIGQPFLGMHISGGTTEAFLVDQSLGISLLSGTEDLHAGQFVDRVGVAMGMHFPCGKQMEALASEVHAKRSFPKLPATVHGGMCSFSGVDTQAQPLIKGGADYAELAYAVYDLSLIHISGIVELAGRVLILALCLPVLMSILEMVGSILSNHAAA